MNNEVLFNITGKVSFAGINTDDAGKKKFACSIVISEETSTKVVDKIGIETGYDSYPIKRNEDGTVIFKAQSGFAFPIYEFDRDGKSLKYSETEIEEIGKDSIVRLSVKVTDSTYKKKNYRVAYLKAIQILELIPFEPFNPFEDDSDLDDF